MRAINPINELPDMSLRLPGTRSINYVRLYCNLADLEHRFVGLLVFRLPLARRLNRLTRKRIDRGGGDIEPSPRLGRAFLVVQNAPCHVHHAAANQLKKT